MNTIDTLEYLRQLGYNNHMEESVSTKHEILSSNFDKTFIGRVIDKETYTDNSAQSAISNVLISRWIVYANGQTFRISVDDSDITSVGQQVRVFIPSNNKQKTYAEVINPATEPDKIVHKRDDSDYDNYKSYGVDTSRGIREEDVTINTITEYWLLADNTYLQKVYIFTLINVDTEEEEVTNVIYPNGKKADLDGFIIGRHGGSDDKKKHRHPDSLEYTDEDEDYTVPETITPDEGETFDTITETWIVDPDKDEQFNTTKDYKVGDIVVYNDKFYKCTVEHKAGEWDSSHFTQIGSELKVVWGVGIINKGEDDEMVNRLVYPDDSYISLINFTGEGGLG